MEDHDLAHVAVEQILQLKNAFFGLIESGVEIADFEDKLKQPDLSTEAIQVEYLVNLLQTEYWNSGEQIDILKLLTETHDQRQLPMMLGLTEELIDEIRKAYHSSIEDLNGLAVGQKMGYLLTC